MNLLCRSILYSCNQFFVQVLVLKQTNKNKNNKIKFIHRIIDECENSQSDYELLKKLRSGEEIDFHEVLDELKTISNDQIYIFASKLLKESDYAKS